MPHCRHLGLFCPRCDFGATSVRFPELAAAAAARVAVGGGGGGGGGLGGVATAAEIPLLGGGEEGVAIIMTATGFYEIGRIDEIRESFGSLRKEKVIFFFFFVFDFIGFIDELNFVGGKIRWRTTTTIGIVVERKKKKIIWV